MNLWTCFLNLPLELRLGGCFLLGACAGSLANWAIYTWAWNQRRISPWSPPEPGAPPRRLTDRIPILGWFGLRRESALHGRGFWIRPMIVELLAGVGLAWLYWWEVHCAHLLPPVIPLELVPLALVCGQFLAHALLAWLMLVASMIDLDERLIPDTVTVPGTLLGLTLAVLYPWVLPTVIDVQMPPVDQPGLMPQSNLVLYPSPLQVTSPYWVGHWPDWLRPWPNPGGLLIAWGCWWLWCVGLMPRTWYTRHGMVRALTLAWARVWRHQATYRILILGAVGTVAIAVVWIWAGQSAWADLNASSLRWVGLMSALVGMAAAGLLVWAVRIIAGNVLKKEAMGFGDVTLMAMIGTFLGWQPCLVIFLLAPFFGLAFGLVRLLTRSEHEIPYGPFLCLATLLVVLRWPDVWARAQPYFMLGSWIPAIIAFCLLLLAGMLILLQGIKRLLFSGWR